ncbi:hypothetical protein VMCG_02026 [Cytospora schulzeri]|uniref:DNA (cytosine-5-)-methyltransferase n=1 Tax=Cytospora schulzeri TaxID=448051 RepID=A0A423X405_9PEZI|nr:hypothetical protein VMCG_02026 [Valsa malicola]
MSNSKTRRLGGSFQDLILDDSDEVLVSSENEQTPSAIIIDLTADDEPESEEKQEDSQEESAEGHPIQDGRRVKMSLRNHPLDGTHRSETSFEVDGIEYRVGQLVELVEADSDYEIKFVEIKSVYVHKETADIVVRGLPYTRTRNLLGRLPRKQNEVCLILEIDDDDERPEEIQALITIGPETILRTRTLIKTNKAFPACRFDEVAYPTKTAREEEAPLTCRWKMRVDYRDHYHRTAGRWNGGIILHMTENDPGIKRRNLGLDKERSQVWRGDTSPGGAIFSMPDAVKIEGRGLHDAQPVQTYSFADILCGSGGISRGAELAGLEVVAAVDPWSVACDSFTANFPNTRLYEMDVPDFVETIDHPHVDILHISPTLQLREKDDETNAAAINTITKLIDKLRPRFLTLDQSPRLGSDANTALFGSLVQACTSHGYSVQWKIINLVDYGLPQLTRKRIFIIGAAPGEKLPPWPTRTHSSEPEGDQQPYMTVKDAISTLDSRIHTLHDPTNCRALNRAPRPLDADEPINGTIPAVGTPFVHPSGRREFTLRELASLHGFPVYHHFEGAYIKKQIGSAFPPSVAKVFFQHIQQWMKEVDGVIPQSSSILKSENKNDIAGRGGKENQANKRPVGTEDDAKAGVVSQDTESIAKHGSLNGFASPQLSPASTTPTLGSPRPRSTSPTIPMRPAMSQTPDPPQTPSASSQSEHHLDGLVPGITPSVASCTGSAASSPGPSRYYGDGISPRKRGRSSYELDEDDTNEPTTEMLETPSKRARYSSPQFG